MLRIEELEPRVMPQGAPVDIGQTIAQAQLVTNAISLVQQTILNVYPPQNGNLAQQLFGFSAMVALQTRLDLEMQMFFTDFSNVLIPQS